MVKKVLSSPRRWEAVRALLTRIARQLVTWPAVDFATFVRAPIGTTRPGGGSAFLQQVDALAPPPPVSMAPATFERWFIKLHAEGRFDEMWEMLAEDAQLAWGGREAFIRDMPRLNDETEFLDMQVVSVSVVEGWTDQMHHRVYSNVARMVMRYRVRQWSREWTFDRQVHLIPADGGWRTLCYPSTARASVTR